MRILILGGTVFLGRHLVEAALAAGHEVTLFNRGQRNPDLFPAVEKLRGHRDGGLDALKGRRWDVVIDTCGYVPRIVRASAELLADAVDHYTFISSISVYSEGTVPELTEESPVGTLPDESVEEITGETYGPLKALCEKAVQQALPGRALIIRPGLIVGAHDPSDRFTYWQNRIAKGGEVLATRPDQAVQVIDVRDLAEWTLRMAVARRTGVFHATGPDTLLSMRQVLEESRTVTGTNASFTWVPDSFLTEHQVEPWMEFPLWVPDDSLAMMRAKITKALDAGLTFRSLADSIRDTLEWDASRPADVERRGGLQPEKEAAVLAAWHAKQA